MSATAPARDTKPAADAKVKVSVIVPVYNPGTYIDECIASILRQSLPADEYEAIFVDDGSTDGTGERLDALAAEHANITSIHIPNSGWPGRPRNVGLDASTGKYVYFVDSDDWIGDEALERLYERAERNEADIVVGKIVGLGHLVSRDLFRRNVDDTPLDYPPLLRVLTSHRLFRRSLLVEHDIRSDEAPYPLEDHLMVVPALFQARRISILADYPCYYWRHREDRGNASLRDTPDDVFYARVRAVLDIVDASTEPGPLRDAFHRHWYRAKGLQRLRGQAVAGDADAPSPALFGAVRRLALERFSPAVAIGLPMVFRVLSRSVTADRLDLVRAQAAIERGIHAEIEPLAVEWDWPMLRLRVRATMRYADGEPITLLCRGSDLSWAPRALAAEPTIGADDLAVTADVPATQMDIVLRDRTTQVEFLVPMAVEPWQQGDDDERPLSFVATADIDMGAAAAGAALGRGTWDLSVRVVSCGLESARRLPCERSLIGDASPSVFGDGASTASPYVTVNGKLSVVIDQAPAVPAAGGGSRQHALLTQAGSDATTDRVKVSVIVPVYNPGMHIDECIASILRQSLPADEYEAIFVDDGSTDGTGERLDLLAAEHANITSIHIPNSGWPGRPRNVGIEASRGKYVYFVDNDDWITDQALERLYERAERNEADIVVGKEIGHGKGVPRHLFRRNNDDAKLLEAPLLDLLTPHKLFRRVFLDEQGIRFPEGRRRLEDHVFVMKAFFSARRISVLADYPCYHWIKREDASNATDHYADPRAYYENIREILDIVDTHTEPGQARDRFYAHWYRSKGLHRMRGPGWAGPIVPHVRQIYAEVRRLALERFGPGVAAALSTKFRVLSRSVVEDRPDLVRAQAALERGLKAEPTLASIEWADGRLRLGLAATFTYADGTPLAVERRDHRLYWAPPAPLGGDPDILDEDLDVTDELPRTGLAVVLRHRGSVAEYDTVASQSGALDPDGEGELTISPRGVADVDACTLAVGAPLDAGVWDIFVQVTSCGWGAFHRLACSSKLLADVQPLPLPGTNLTAVPYVTAYGNLSLKIARVRATSAGSPVSTAAASSLDAAGAAEPAGLADAPRSGAPELLAAVQRFRDPGWAEGPNARARAVFAEVRAVALDSIPEAFPELPMALRVLARAALADRLDLVRGHVRLARGLRSDLTVEDSRPEGVGAGISVSVGLRYAGQPVLLRSEAGRVFWVPPAAISDPAILDADLDVTDELARTTVTVLRRLPDGGTDLSVLADLLEVAVGDELAVRVRADLPKTSVASDGQHLEGLRAAIETCGWFVEQQLPAPGSPLPPPPGVARGGLIRTVARTAPTPVRRFARRTLRRLQSR